ncbi:MAG TPA: TlyA family RNA methyltransferase [Thermoanaerobaculaceae bacterium]|nr:TlyA family RNA methyltransferase [Thermoanaerobaculaceae bacterium]
MLASLMARNRTRLDQALVERGLAPSRARAQGLVLAGVVRIDGQVADKPGRQVDHDATITVDAPDHPWVSRGGVKLAAALDAFGLDPAGRRCLDVGASTGGFTHVLLARGAASVVAVDVGKGQLDWRLRQDPRVEVRDGVNARLLTPSDLPGPFELVVVDVSFISLRLVLPALRPLLANRGDLVALVKPQFEVGRGQVGKGGVVRDPAAREAAILGVIAAAGEQGLALRGRLASPLPGPAGNVEELVWLTPSA